MASTRGWRTTSACRARSAVGLVQQGRRDGSYLTDQLKPREQRTNQALTWSVEALIRDHNERSAVVRRLFDASRGMAE